MPWNAEPKGSACIAPSFSTWAPGSEPDEETHYNAYLQVVQAMAGRPVVIRTLDMGADKVLPDFDTSEPAQSLPGPAQHSAVAGQLAPVPHPAAGDPAGQRLGDVRIMFPLISTLLELRQAKMVLADVMEDLEEQQIPFNREMPVGMMVEVPAAVLMIDRFVEEVDFLSIGTNDLIQYTLAVDRANKEVASLYNACRSGHPRLLKTAIDAGTQRGIPVNVCGQMSGSTTYTMLLLGLGLRGFSVPPSAVPEIKKVCRSVKIPQCMAVAERVMTMEHCPRHQKLFA